MGSDPSCGPALLAEAQSPLGARMLRLDVDVAQALLVAGDRTGSVLAFHVPPGALQPGHSGEHALGWCVL